MKKVLFILAFVVSIVISACSSVSSLPSTMIVYYEPVLVSQTSVVIGSGFDYAGARNSAIRKAEADGYTKIVAESIGMNSISGLIDVTLVIIK